MKTGDILVIESVRELWDDKHETLAGVIVVDKAGAETKIKKGQGGKLQERWRWLNEEGVGQAIQLVVGEFKGYPFVADFTVVKDEFKKQAAEKVQSLVKVERNDSIESQVAFKGMIELIATGIVKNSTKEYKATIEWAMSRLHSVAQIMAEVEKAKVATDNQEQDSEAPKTAGEFLNWIMKLDPNIKAPRAWLQVEYGVTDKEILTAERIKELYDKIKK